MKEYQVHYFLMDGRGESYQSFGTKKRAKEFMDRCKSSIYLKNLRLEVVVHTQPTNNINGDK